MGHCQSKKKQPTPGPQHGTSSQQLTAAQIAGKPALRTLLTLLLP
jgi:hypothetical protein